MVREPGECFDSSQGEAWAEVDLGIVVRRLVQRCRGRGCDAVLRALAKLSVAAPQKLQILIGHSLGKGELEQQHEGAVRVSEVRVHARCCSHD